MVICFHVVLAALSRILDPRYSDHNSNPCFANSSRTVNSRVPSPMVANQKCTETNTATMHIVTCTFLTGNAKYAYTFR